MRAVAVSAKLFRVFGRVQGVFYRGSACDEARRLGLVGWVKNLPDGSVQAYACGDTAALSTFAAWLSIGPPLAEVTEVVVSDAAVDNLSDFRVS